MCFWAGQAFRRNQSRDRMCTRAGIKRIMRAISLITERENLLDHLGVLSECLEIPLIVSDPKVEALAHRFYPHLKTIYKDLDELTLEYFAENYDIVFETNKFFATEMAPFIRLLF